MDVTEYTSHLEARRFPLIWKGHMIGGEWKIPQKTKQVKTSYNPSRGTPLIEIRCDRQVVADAVNVAAKAKHAYANITLPERLELIRRFRQALTDFQHAATLTLRLEAGKPAWEAEEAVHKALQYLEWISSSGEIIMDQLRGPAKACSTPRSLEFKPIGVLAAYLPFASAMTSFALYFSSAVFSGCPLVLVCSGHATLSAMLYAMLAEKIGLPNGALNIVFGDFDSFKHALSDKQVGAVLFAGSPEHCHTIRSESRAFGFYQQMVLQSGGKNTAIIHESANVDQAIQIVAKGAFKSAGQLCTSTSRVFIPRSKAKEFNERIIETVTNLSIGPTDEPTTSPLSPAMGPLYSKKAVEKFLRFQTMANRDAEETLLWGKAVNGPSGGFFVTPGVHFLKEVDEMSAYQGNILFCPDISIYPYDHFDSALEQINSSHATFATTYVGDPEALNQSKIRFMVPNLLVNLPTIEAEETFPLTGKAQNNLHMFNGAGILLYLMYPQSILYPQT